MYFDPYKVLGVNSDATDEEVKKAYRDLSRRYHPDANVNNPNKAQAEEKFKQVQQAYDQIMKHRENGGYDNGAYSDYGHSDPYGGFDPFGGFGGSYGGWSQTREDDTYTMHLNAAQNYITAGRFAEALNVLNSMGDKDGRWYYLYALANSGIGKNYEAVQSAKTAVDMEPGNMKYKSLLEQLEGGGTYQQNRGIFGGYGMPFGSNAACNSICVIYALCMCCSGGMTMMGGYGRGGIFFC